MKRMFVVLSVILAVFFLCTVAWAGEKEELDLKKQVLTERFQKIQLQQTLLQQQIEITKKEYDEIEAKLKKFEPADKPKEKAKK